MSLGRLLVTAGARSEISNDDVLLALSRHVRGDWGELDPDDKAANDRALAMGGRLLSAYRGGNGRRFWVITEWDRSATTVLLPEDY
ncbi:MAG: hypothetical protein HZA52_18830 [Planctomycetes bacterium]|nr:hypothetical protein [Planctomycetota bacterium]